MYRPGGGVGPPPPPSPRKCGWAAIRSKSVSTGTRASTGMSGGLVGLSTKRWPSGEKATGGWRSLPAVATRTRVSPDHAARWAGTGR